VAAIVATVLLLAEGAAVGMVHFKRELGILTDQDNVVIEGRGLDGRGLEAGGLEGVLEGLEGGGLEG
jgi:hypothetical protein